MHQGVARFIILLLFASISIGCRSVRSPEPPNGSDLTVLSYNVNWSGAGAMEAVEILRRSDADIICLQETTPEWERYLQHELRRKYSFMQFRESIGRMGGGLAFLSKVPGREVEYIPSETGWFDSWIMEFETQAVPIQVLNVHLRPPVSDRGGWVSGYVTTRDDRVWEMQRFYERLRPGLAVIVAGDFNDSEGSPVVKWLEDHGLENSLREFDRSTETWKWQYRGVVLKRRMDFIFYAPQHLFCAESKVLKEGGSDHFPLLARFRKKVL